MSATFRIITLFLALTCCALVRAAETPAANGEPALKPGGAIRAKVTGNTLTSTTFPVGRMVVDKAFTYVGATSFVLYDAAECELHIFADIKDNQVQRYYWVQFEGYLPNHPTTTYNYSNDPQDTMIGGHAFHRRSWAGNTEDAKKRSRQGSDGEAVRNLFESKGYRMAPEMMGVRLVRLDESKRRELMIIYSENLESRGLKAADLAVDGSAFGKRSELFDGLRDRAVAGIQMEMK